MVSTHNLECDVLVAGWPPFSSENKGAARWDKAIGRKQPGSLQIDDGTGVIDGGIDVVAGRHYRIQGWYMADNPATNAMIEMLIEWKDSKQQTFAYHYPAILLPVGMAS